MRKLLVFTGAGVSRESGIPTFVEMGDIREKLSRTFFRKNPEELYRILNEMRDTTLKALPNEAHLAIAKAAIPVITMNIDGLHQRAGSSSVIEIHGGMEWVDCPNCGKTYGFDLTKTEIYSPCCNRVLETRVVLYEDSLGLLPQALNWVDQAEALLIVGTSFYTSTASYIADRAKRNGIPVTVINESAGVQVPIFLNEFMKSES